MANKLYVKRISLDFEVRACDQKAATATIACMLENLKQHMPEDITVSVIGRTQRVPE